LHESGAFIYFQAGLHFAGYIPDQNIVNHARNAAEGIVAAGKLQALAGYQILPSGLKARPRPNSLNWKTHRFLPVAASNRRTSPSFSPRASKAPSGLKAAAVGYMEGIIFLLTVAPPDRQPVLRPACQQERTVRQHNQADDFAFARSDILAQRLDDVDIEE
jgi:hypothetical protein